MRQLASGSSTSQDANYLGDFEKHEINNNTKKSSSSTPTANENKYTEPLFINQFSQYIKQKSKNEIKDIIRQLRNNKKSVKDIADETSIYLQSTQGALSDQNAVDLFKYSNSAFYKLGCCVYYFIVFIFTNVYTGFTI